MLSEEETDKGGKSPKRVRRSSASALPAGISVVFRHRTAKLAGLVFEVPLTPKMPPLSQARRERRAWPRLPLALPIFVRGTDQEGNDFLEFTTALNVSAGGMLVGLRRNLLRATHVLLEVPSAPSPETALPAVSSAARKRGAPGVSVAPARNFQARLVRSIEGAGWRLCGFRFVHPLDSAKREIGFRR